MTTACPYCGSGDIAYDLDFNCMCASCGAEFDGGEEDYNPLWEDEYNHLTDLQSLLPNYMITRRAEAA